MPYHSPSTIADEGSHPLPDSNRTLVCPSCGDTMRHLRTVPKIGVRQEKLIFACPSCKEVDTKEIKSTRRDTGSSVPSRSAFRYLRRGIRTPRPRRPSPLTEMARQSSKSEESPSP
jgi:hypothetical protein